MIALSSAALRAATCLALAFAPPQSRSDGGEPAPPRDPRPPEGPEPPPTEPGAVPPEASGPADADDPRVLASAAFAAAEAAFSEGRFSDAVASFERAQSLVPHPNTLYNLGLAQQAGGDLPAAWRTFGAVERGTQDRLIRADARARMSEIEQALAVLFVVADPQATVCLDGRAIPQQRPGRYEDVVKPGPHELAIDGHVIRTELYAGQTRALFLEHADQIWASQRPSRAVPALAGTAVGAATLAAGLGFGAMASGRDRSPGLTAGAAVSALVAMGAGTGALVLSLREGHGNDETTTPAQDARLHGCPADVAAEPGPGTAP